MFIMSVISKAQTYLATAVLIVSCAYAAFTVFKRLRAAFKMNINVVSSSEECERLINELRRRSMDHNAVGFDCEWVTEKTKRKPVALLQLATHDGFCVLVRLNLLEQPLPPSLIGLLEDASIYKVGLAPLNDANYLSQDYGVDTVATVDLRHFAEMCGYRVGGLAHLTETLLGIVLDKSLKVRGVPACVTNSPDVKASDLARRYLARIFNDLEMIIQKKKRKSANLTCSQSSILEVRCSNWDAETLTPAQLQYAASDAYAAICIFVKLMRQLDEPEHRSAWSAPDCDDSIWDRLDEICGQYADYNYKQIASSPRQDGQNKPRRTVEHKEKMTKNRYPHMKRTKPLYDNCYLQAPDGEVLSTIDGKKALWYVDKGLAERVGDEPLTVRLVFEPAGRSVGEVGRYYTLKKENQCVVCGEKNSYIRKNVVPREYRKYFPDTMKDHSSHDIVLLCARCHQRSNIRDQTTRAQLAARCHAPLPRTGPALCVEDRHCKKVRMAARALVNNKVGKCKLPDARREELEAEVLNYYTDHTEVTDDLLQQALELSVIVENENQAQECHGVGVVRHFLEQEPGGLLQLEELWRNHFLTAMRPRHMPDLWSPTHNVDRLRVKWNEGRLFEKDLQAIGNVRWLFDKEFASQ